MKFVKINLARIAGGAAALGLAAAACAQTITLDNFDSGSATGAVRNGTSWVGNVAQNAGSITVGGTAKDENGWGKTGIAVDASGLAYVRITAQRDAGNAGSSVAVQFEDPGAATTVFSVSASAFATGTLTTVQIPIAAWEAGFDASAIAGWNIGGGTVGTAAYRMTFDHLALATGLLPLSAGGLLVTAGHQVYAGAQTLTAATTVGTTGVNGNDITFDSTIDGAQALTFNTPGTVTFGDAVGRSTPLAGLATDAGGTTRIDGGGITTSGAQTYRDVVSLGADTTIRNIGAGLIQFFEEVVGNAHALLIDSPHDVAFNFASGLTSLTKSGAGTLTLSGQSTYAGGTIIDGGTLALGRGNALPGASPLTLGGGTLALGGFSQTLGPLTLAASSAIDFGAGAGALVFAGSDAQAWTGTLSILNYTTSADSLRFGAASTALTPAQLSVIDFGAGFFAVIDANGFVLPSAIPEPSTYAALAGLAALGLALRRRARLRVNSTEGRMSRNT